MTPTTRRIGTHAGSLLDTLARDDAALTSRIAYAAAHQSAPVRSALVYGSGQTLTALRSVPPDGGAAWPEIAQRLRRIGAEHARSGHPMSDLLIARRLHRHLVVEHVRSTGERLASSRDEVLGSIDAMITACNRVSAELVSGYREAEPSLLQADQARAVFVHDLLWGTLDPRQRTTEAHRFGVDTSRDYLALRARPERGQRMDELVRTLGFGLGRSNGGGLGVIVDGDLVGFLTSQPAHSSVGVLGLGPPRPFELLHESFRMASRALHAARRRQLSGVCDFERLGLLPAVLIDEATGAALCRRYLFPLGDSPFASEITDTLRMFLECGMNAPRSARALFVHTNTVRYRISRFEELTGVTLRDNPTAAFEVLWALEHHAMRRRPSNAEAG